jgi:hypothetical protein
MQMYFDKNGQILRINRPYINHEETGQVFAIYNPEGGPHYGLYDVNPYPYCQVGNYFWPNTVNRDGPNGTRRTPITASGAPFTNATGTSSIYPSSVQYNLLKSYR